MLELKLVELRPWKVDPERLPAHFNANARCDFHSGGKGNTIENFYDLKHKVQDLLNSQAINFGPSSNITNQPILTHGGATINAILEDENFNLIMDVNQLITPL